MQHHRTKMIYWKCEKFWLGKYQIDYITLAQSIYRALNNLYQYINDRPPM